MRARSTSGDRLPAPHPGSSVVATYARQRTKRDASETQLGSVRGFVEYVQSLEAEVRSLRAIVAKIGDLIGKR